jgi:predicted lipoprotein
MNRQICFGALVVLSVAPRACPPWTVRPIGSKSQTVKQVSPVNNPAAYVDSIWASKLIPAVMSSAVDAPALLEALRKSPEEAQKQYGHRETGGPVYFVVKGQGRVTAVNATSRVRVAMVDLPPFDGRPDVSIQIGPVLRGTSLRDATGLVRFTDFVNQLQYADAGNELNERVLKTVLSSLDASALTGAHVSFVGTCAVDSNAEPSLRDLIPVQLKLEDR